MADQSKTLGILANRPFVVCLLYLATYFTGIGCVVGVVLAYIFRSGAALDWEASHYTYLIATFWILAIGLLLPLSAILLMLNDYKWAAVVFVPFLAILVLVSVRTVLSLVNAVLEKPMPRPKTLLF